MNKSFKSVCFFGILFFIIDQAIKMFLSSKMVLGQTNILIKDFLNITYVHNTGAAFSLFSGNRWLLVFVGVFATICLLVYIAKLVHLTDFDIFSYSLLLGGVLGNLVDRIFRGYVVDYISLNIFGYHFPIFNFADMCIVVSIILIFCSALKGDLWKE